MNVRDRKHKVQWHLRNGWVSPEPTAGALTLWRTELSYRRRTKSDFDSLWRAACWELEAQEAAECGLIESAGIYRCLAAKILEIVVRQEKRAVPE